LDYYLFCSKEHPDKDNYLKILIGLKPQLQIDNYRFLIGQFVHVMEFDHFGLIARARSYETGKQAEEIKNKKEFDVKRARHVLEIDGRSYDSNHVIIHPADIQVISKFGGAPRRSVFFFCGKNTTLLDLLSATKYCTEKMYIILPHDLKFSDIQKPTSFEMRNTLTSKLQKMDLF